MIVLGICDGHEAGVCLVADGRIQFAVSEERLSRKKGAMGFPGLSIAACFQETGLDPKDVGAVAVAEIAGRAPMRLLDARYRKTERNQGPLALQSRALMLYQNHAAQWPLIRPADSAAGRAALKRRLSAFGLGRARLNPVFHHWAHLCSAAYTSGWERALAISLDGFGEGLCGMAALLEGGTLRPLDRFPAAGSLGLLYGIVAEALGFEEGDEGKVLGLAAHGDPKLCRTLFQEKIFVGNGRPHLSPKVWDFAFYRQVGLRKREDIAAALQERLEDCICELAGHWMKKTGERRLCLSGGVFANIRATQVLKNRLGAEPYVFPHMGDGGLCAGAALEVWRAFSGKEGTPAPLERADLGPALQKSEIESAIAARASRLVVQKPESVAEAAADLLAQGKTVAWIRGRSEFGPRALGRRSVLADPRRRKTATDLCKALDRPEFMPFGPIVAEENAAALFSDLEGASRLTPFMTSCLNAAPGLSDEAPAAVHLDGTARPQIVGEREQPELHETLLRFEQKTGCRCLINTSMNRHGEPIVQTADDALETFLMAGLDAMILGNTFVKPRILPVE